MVLRHRTQCRSHYGEHASVARLRVTVAISPYHGNTAIIGHVARSVGPATLGMQRAPRSGQPYHGPYAFVATIPPVVVRVNPSTPSEDRRVEQHAACALSATGPKLEPTIGRSRPQLRKFVTKLVATSIAPSSPSAVSRWGVRHRVGLAPSRSIRTCQDRGSGQTASSVPQADPWTEGAA